MVMLGHRRTSAAQGLLYTSLLPSSGPTKLSYSNEPREDENPLTRYSSKAANIIWSDLDGAPLTAYRKASKTQVIGEFDEPETPPSHTPRRASRAHTTNLADLDVAPIVYRRATHEEKKEYGENYALMPYEPVVIEETLSTKPICRSDTVANLLDKYTNFSPRREFGYRSPGSAYSRHLGETHAFVSTLPDLPDEEETRRTHSRSGPPLPIENDLPLSRSREHSRSRTPRALSTGREISVLSRESLPIDEPIRSSDILRAHDPYSSRDSQYSYGRDSSMSHNRSRFSNIYEEDEEENLPSLETRIQRRAAAIDNDDIDSNFESSLPKGRPGGALERYKQRKAREAQGVYERLSSAIETNGVLDDTDDTFSKTSQVKKTHTCKHRMEEQEPQRKTQDLYHQDRQDPYMRGVPDPYGRPGQDPYSPYGMGSVNPYGRTSQDRYGSSAQDPYGRRSQDPYGRQSHDPYGRQAQDPYGRLSQDPYGRPSQDPYGRPPQDPYDRSAQDPYSRGAPEPYSRGAPDPYSRGAPDPYSRASSGMYGRASADLYGRDYQEPYGRGPLEPYGRGRMREESYGGEYGRGDLSSRDEDDRQYGGYSSRQTSSYGGASESFGYGGADADDLRSSPIRNTTPRDEERSRIAILASKYLK